MQKTQAQSLGWEDTPEKGMATHSSILAWEIPGTVESGRHYSPWGHKVSDMIKEHEHTCTQACASGSYDEMIH